MTDKIGVQVGGVSRQAVEAVEKAILSILTAPAEQKTIRAALSALTALTQIPPTQNLALHNIHADVSETHHHAAPPSPDPSDADEGNYD